ncbi:phosphoribosylglycinamide formyltransferase [Pseudofrancisella aestuarii]|uniref:Phosphoribosylglycinamide formyltransferase n=1 Tax=Pseudofrancisella aestuarii TaxID=2670347 RepID=A0ABV9TBP1_9GAMM|nr:phosphoribosylglycinamide formyltransferase [Pseudofrancisella aestuarii]
MAKLNLVILGSTRGSNMQAIIDAIQNQELNAHISLVISNKKDAYILERAKSNNIENIFISAKDKTREEYDKIVANEINKYQPDLILLIGYMRILSKDFVNSFKNKILNIHPSLLPKHPGLMDLAVHQAVINAKDEETGCTIHEVTEEVDSGKIILQLKCKVDKSDCAEELKEKVQELEKKAWIQVIKNWKKEN